MRNILFSRFDALGSCRDSSRRRVTDWPVMSAVSGLAAENLRKRLGSTMSARMLSNIWVVVKIMVPFWIPIIIRHLIYRVPKKGP